MHDNDEDVHLQRTKHTKKKFEKKTGSPSFGISLASAIAAEQKTTKQSIKWWDKHKNIFIQNENDEAKEISEEKKICFQQLNKSVNDFVLRWNAVEMAKRFVRGNELMPQWNWKRRDLLVFFFFSFYSTLCV